MLDMFSYQFMQNAFLASILVSIAAGIIGSLVVVNKMSYLAGGIAHCSYGGIGLAVFFSLPIVLGASVFAVIAALIIAILTLKERTKLDATIGIIWAGGMAIGIVFIDLTSGYNVDLLSYLFGSILSVSRLDIYYTFVLDILVLVLVGVYYKEFLAVSYDSEFAALRGVKVNVIYTLILLLCAFSIVALIQIVGLILVIALLSIPPYIAKIFCNNLSKMMLVSVFLSLIFTLSGLVVSYYTNISSGACIVLIALLIFILVKIYAKCISLE